MPFSLFQRRLVSYTFTLLLIHQLYLFYNWILFYNNYEKHYHPPSSLNKGPQRAQKAHQKLDADLTRSDPHQYENNELPYREFFSYIPASLSSPIGPQSFDKTSLYHPPDCTDLHCAIIAPSYIIIGAQKSGTTSLYYYLQKHPQIVELSRHSKAMGEKEIRFFDKLNNYTGIFDEYISHFPSIQEVKEFGHSTDRLLVSGESTPNYLRYPHAPERLSKLFPKMKIIVMLRDPVDRAYSHYNHAIRTEGNRKIYTGGNSYEKFIEAEEQIIEACKDKHYRWIDFSDCYGREAGQAAMELGVPLRNTKNADSSSNDGKKKAGGRLTWMFQSILRGLYASQLINWANYFPATQFLIIKSEEFYSDARTVMGRVEKFLDIDAHDWTELGRDGKEIYNFGEGNKVKARETGSDYAPMDNEIRKKLRRIFTRYNQDLKGLFKDRQFPLWDYSD